MDNHRRSGLSTGSFHISRIESLTDGVFAIAMTLLVLDLRVAPGHTQAQLAGELANLATTITSYVVSFFLAAVFWWSYHRILQRLTHSDNGMVWWNIGFLFFVTLLPFSTLIVGAYASTRLGTEIYCANLIALSTLLLAQWSHANRHGLVDPEHLDGRRLQTARLIVPLICYIAAGIVGWFVPQHYYVAFFAIPVLMVLARRLVRDTPT